MIMIMVEMMTTTMMMMMMKIETERNLERGNKFGNFRRLSS